MSSFTVQGFKDTLQGMQATASKIIPAVGTFLGHSVTVISANPLATAAVVAAVIVVSLVVFAAYKHYQFHQQLKADNASLKNLLETSTFNLETSTFNTESALVELKKANQKATALEIEKDVIASKIEEALETGNWAVECQNSEIENKTNSLKEAYQELNTLCKVKDEMDKEISRRKKDKKVYKQAAEELVADLQLEIKILKNKIAVK